MASQINKVFQLDLSGKLINEFNSAKEASEKLNLTIAKIRSSCRKNSIVNKQYRFKYDKPIKHKKSKISLEEFVELAKKAQGDKFDNYIYLKEYYTKATDKVGIICKKHGLFWQRGLDHLNGRGCSECSNVKKMTKEIFITKVKAIYGDKFDLSEVEYKNNKTKVKIYCNECKKYFYKRPNDLLSGYGCPYCVGLYKTTEEYIDELKNLRDDFDEYDYSEAEYTSATCYITITHKICGHKFKQMANNHRSGCKCPKCAAFPTHSKLELKVGELLKEHNIIYEFQKTFDWLKYKSFLYLDYFLPEYNVAVEVQGDQHFHAYKGLGGEKNLKEQQARDATKLELCKEHGFKMFYITNKNPNIDEILNYINATEYKKES